MAEIPVERKDRKKSLLPLVFLGLLAVLLLGYCFTRDRGEVDPALTMDTGVGAVSAAGGDTLAGPAGTMPAGQGAAGVDAFVQFVAARDTSAETEDNHQYTSQGIRLLASALEGMAGGTSVQVYADSMRSAVDRLQRSSATDAHADDARAAFNAAVSAMEAIDRAQGRTRDAAAMRGIARELESNRPLVPQLGTVHRFFEAARDALQSMRAAT